MKKFLSIIILLLIVLQVNAADHEKLFIISPQNGDVVSNPVTIKFGIKGMNIVPAGVNEMNSGHHHLLINLETLPNLSSPIPADSSHLHFGKGQTETTIDLKKGKNSLQLLLGDHNHIPHKPALISKKIYITVE